MRSAFSHVTANKLKSHLLIVLFIIFIGLVGSAAGYLYGNPYIGAIMATAGAGVYAMITLKSGDKMILRMTGAKEVKKQEYPHLFHTLEGLAIAAGIPKPKAYVIDDSALNAFATGKNPEHASITVTTGLLNKLNRQELEGVIAHEMSHIKNYDIRYMMLTIALVGVLLLIGDFLFYSFVFGRRGGSRQGGHPAIMIAAIVLIILSPVIAEMIKLSLSRKREYLADASGTVMTRYPEGLASALEKIKNDPDPRIESANRAAAHLFISNPIKKKSFSNLFSTHPPLDERIKRLRAM